MHIDSRMEEGSLTLTVTCCTCALESVHKAKTSESEYRTFKWTVSALITWTCRFCMCNWCSMEINFISKMIAKIQCSRCIDTCVHLLQPSWVTSQSLHMKIFGAENLVLCPGYHRHINAKTNMSSNTLCHCHFVFRPFSWPSMRSFCLRSPHHINCSISLDNHF